MKLVPIPFLSVIVCLAASCGNNPQQKKHSAEPVQPVSGSLIDSLNKKVNEGHDFSMSKMGTMVKLQKSIKASVDSLQKLDQVDETRISALKQASHNLDAVNGSMYKWMESFDFDLKNMDSVTKVQYLRTNLKRIEEIDDSTRQFIENAEKELQP